MKSRDWREKWSQVTNFGSFLLEWHGLVWVSAAPPCFACRAGRTPSPWATTGTPRSSCLAAPPPKSTTAKSASAAASLKSTTRSLPGRRLRSRRDSWPPSWTACCWFTTSFRGKHSSSPSTSSFRRQGCVWARSCLWGVSQFFSAPSSVITKLYHLDLGLDVGGFDLGSVLEEGGVREGKNPLFVLAGLLLLCLHHQFHLNDLLL